MAGEVRDDLPIPGERYGFATLKMAQALGDLATLRAANRRVVWLPIAGSAVAAIDHLRVAFTRKLS
jgi:hypothetical protein